MEKIFRLNITNMESYNGMNLRKHFIQQFQAIPFFLPNCHELRIKIIRRFVVCRLKVYFKAHKSTSKTTSNVTYASKTMSMHMRIK